MVSVQRWMDLDVDFALHDIVGGETFGVVRLEAPSPWTVTASHAVSHLDEQGTSWPSDRGTGGLAMVLHETAPVRALVASGRWDADPDSVPGHLCPFKSFLMDEFCPTVVIDLHEGARNADIEFDSGARPELSRSLLNHAEHAARRNGLTFAARATLPWHGCERVIDTVQSASVPAVRLSISSHLLDPWTRPLQAAILLSFFEDLFRAPTQIR